MSKDAVLTIFEDIRRRVLRISDATDDAAGFVLSLMPVGQPIWPDDYANPWTPAMKSAAGAGQKAQQSLYNLSRLVDNKLSMDGAGAVMPGSTPISQTWKTILDAAQSERGSVPPSPQAAQRLNEAQTFLYQTDAAGLAEKTPIYMSYDKYKRRFEDAKLAYVAAYQDVLQSGLEDQWPVVGTTHLGRLDDARDEWDTLGNRHAVEAKIATIGAQGKDAIEAVIAEAKKAYEPWQLTLSTIGATTPYVQVFPSNWTSSTDDDSGWSRYRYTSRSASTSHSDETTTWGARAGVSFGFWSVGGGGGSTERHVHDEFSSNDLEIELTYGIATIDRPWLRSILLNVSGWALLGQDRGVISNGEADQTLAPSEEAFWLPSLPTQMILVKNVRIRTEDIEKTYDYLQSHLSAGGSFGWGFFSLGGSYSKDRTETKTNFRMEEGWLVIDGAQLIGWVSQVMPNSPTESGR